MIDISKLEESETKTNVSPSNNIFVELGKNTYDYKDLISELIDNSIAARRNDRRLIVTIELYVDSNNNPIEFIIKDNASGITPDKLGATITPAGIQSLNSLNEHGLGMKQAVAALGKLKYLATKTESEEKARVILEFKFGEIPTYYAQTFDYDSGTEIAVTNLKSIVISNPTVITRSLIPYLGARYRRFLRPDNKIMDLHMNIRRQNNGDVLYSWEIEEVKPIYFHPSTRTNKPVIIKYPLSGSGWKAELTFGYAPQEKEEYEELGIEPPNKFHPYYVSLSKQGLDIIRHNRVVLFHQLSEIGIISARHPDFNNIRGEIDLLEGFSTAITKNSIIMDEHFRECIDEVRKILRGEKATRGGKKKDYLKGKKYPEQIPERLLRDRLATWLSSNPLHKRSDVQTEYVVQGIEGYVDILADGEAWEIKPEQASARDVYQLFMYMDVGGFDKGFLVAKDFTTGANVAASHISKKHKKEIVLTTLDKFPIIHPPSDEEREEYY
ncbi:MAG: ATP-binding protein [Thermoplasmata archaeon]|nr:ATP-binding protein [Thermoplasmata archaeon]